MKHAEIVDHIVNWLDNYLAKNHLKGFVLGISGGIDSALASTLCAKTGAPVLGVEMPIHQGAQEVNRARKHLNWLENKFSNVSREKVDLTNAFDQLCTAFPNNGPQEDNSLILANTRARLRMTTLYYFAGLSGLIVVGTGNKIEDFGIGFYTKYGDGGVDISPLADLNKTEVFTLSKFLGLDKSLLAAKPTDGLFGDNRSDEEQIGATYPELEWAMKQDQNAKTENDFSGKALKIFKLYRHRNRINQHKWNPIPVCLIPENLKS